MTRRVFGSLTRISDLATEPYELERLPHSAWATGDYIEAEIVPPVSKLYHVEDRTGFMDPVKPGDTFIGALGHRAATLEGAGSWKDVYDDRLHALTTRACSVASPRSHHCCLTRFRCATWVMSPATAPSSRCVSSRSRKMASHSIFRRS